MIKLSMQEHALLTEEVLSQLALRDITTITEFLQEKNEKLITLSTLTLPEVVDIRTYFLSRYTPPLINIDTLLAESNIRKFIPTNIQSLDAALEGGIPVGSITELCGLAGSGKTQLCFQFAINCAKSKCAVLYIDTKGDFSALRIQKILQIHGYNLEEMGSIMSNIRVVHIWTLKDAVELLHLVKNGMITNLGLLIIDSLTTLMLQHLGDDNKIGLTFLCELVSHVRFMSRKLSTAVVSVNIQTRWLVHDTSDMDERSRSGRIRLNPDITTIKYRGRKTSVAQLDKTPG